MRKFIIAMIGGASALAAAPSYAQDDAERVSVSITGGSLGVGPEVDFRWSEHIGVRANATFLSVSHSINSDDIGYDGKIKLKSGGAMIDLYPFGGGFRVSGGLRLNGNKARAVATPTGPVYIGDNQYQPSQIGTLTATTSLNYVAPAATLGYAGGFSKHVVFAVEAGALFQGTVKVNPLTYTGACASAAAPAACSTLAADIESERQSVNNDIKDYKIYPILQLSIGYRF